jgi:hypothetical protein
LCSQSSFSTSSGNSNRPAEGRILYFSDTVWVFRSSSLPARDGARESSNGDAKGLICEWRLVCDSELQLVRREDMAEGDPIGDSSRKALVLDFFGGSSRSADSANPPAWYGEFGPGDRIPGLGAVPGRIGVVSERAECWRDVLGRWGSGGSAKMSCEPELRRMCGVAFPSGDCGGDMAAERAYGVSD